MAKMDRRGFLASTGAGLTAPLIMGKTDKLKPKNPLVRNVVLFIVDDFRWDFLSYMDHPLARTRYMDRVAAEGMFFENAYVTTSLWLPSIYSTLTGLYAHKHGAYHNLSEIKKGTPLLPSQLKMAEYKTGFVGRWNVHGSDNLPREEFDYWMCTSGDSGYYNPVINENGKREKKTGYVTDMITEHAEKFIDKSRKDDFFLVIAHKGTGAMFEPSPRHKGSFADARVPRPASMADTDGNYEKKPEWVRRARKGCFGVDGMYAGELDFDTMYRNYCETLLSVDESLGKIYNSLVENEILDETLLVVTGGNGFIHGEHGLIDKRNMYEPSIRVPLIVHCPALVKAHSRRKETVLNIDLCPTILEAMGLEPFKESHGESLVSIFRGNAIPNWRSLFLYEYFWERSFPHNPSVVGLRTGQYSYMRYRGIWDKCELYDMSVDFDQRNNLLGEVVIRDHYEPEFTDYDDPFFDIHNCLIEQIGLRNTVWELDKRLRNILLETGGMS